MLESIIETSKDGLRSRALQSTHIWRQCACLLDAGADANAQGDKGQSPLHLAARRGSLDIVRLLLQSGADPNAVDHRGWTSLHHGSDAGCVDIVQLLLTNGSDVNAASGNNGNTPLRFAVKKGYLGTVRALLDAGANPWVINKANHTALDLRVGNDECRDEIRSLLTEALEQRIDGEKQATQDGPSVNRSKSPRTGNGLSPHGRNQATQSNPAISRSGSPRKVSDTSPGTATPGGGPAVGAAPPEDISAHVSQLKIEHSVDQTHVEPPKRRRIFSHALMSLAGGSPDHKDTPSSYKSSQPSSGQLRLRKSTSRDSLEGWASE